MKLSDANIKSFWSKVKVRGPRQCWPWLGHTQGSMGYGRFQVVRGKKVKNLAPHRVAYALKVLETTYLEDIKLQVLHSCDNPICCNPRHLREGTQLDNMRDKMSRGRWKGRSLPEEDKLKTQVKELREEGLSHADVAKELKIGSSTVGRWCKKYNW